MRPNLDEWISKPTLRVAYRRDSAAPPEQLWEAARSVRLRDTRLLGRLVRWRIPGLSPSLSFDEMFRNPPFIALVDGDDRLVAGLVGRIWTLRRDYPQPSTAEEFRGWSSSGTAQVVFANWIEPAGEGTALHSETRVRAIGAQGRVGVAAVRPLVSAFAGLVGSDGLEAAVRAAERR